MDTASPTEEEAQQLRRLQTAARRRGRISRFCLLLNALFLLYVFAAGRLGFGVLVAYACALVVMTYVVLIQPLLTRCPRCQSRMTMLKGRCTSCGLRLSPAPAGARSSEDA